MAITVSAGTQKFARVVTDGDEIGDCGTILHNGSGRSTHVISTDIVPRGQLRVRPRAPFLDTGIPVIGKQEDIAPCFPAENSRRRRRRLRSRRQE